jgi:hypothetical protein
MNFHYYRTGCPSVFILFIPVKLGSIINKMSTAQILMSRVPPTLNPLTPNDLQGRRAVSLLKIKIHSKNMREKPTNTPIIHSVY